MSQKGSWRVERWPHLPPPPPRARVSTGPRQARGTCVRGRGLRVQPRGSARVWTGARVDRRARGRTWRALEAAQRRRELAFEEGGLDGHAELEERREEHAAQLLHVVLAEGLGARPAKRRAERTRVDAARHVEREVK